MADKNKKEITEPEVITEKSKITETEGIKETVDFFKKYQNYFFIGLMAIALGVIAYMFLGKKSNPTAVLKADAKLQYPQSRLQQDSFDIALNGDANGEGFLSIIKKNSGNSVGDQARVEAAVCYLKTNRPKDAVKLLEDVSGLGKQLNAKRLCLIGDAKGDMAVDSTGTVTNKKLLEESAEYYEKAGNQFPEDNISANYLFRAGQTFEKLGKEEAAKKIYLMIKEKYVENSQIISEVDKYLAKMGVVN